MKGVKIKTVKDKDLAEMFNQMLGAGSVNMNIVYPKYAGIRDYSIQLVNIMDMFANSSLLKNPQMAETRKELLDFVEFAKKRIQEVFCKDYSKYVFNLNLIDDKERAEFSTIYEQMKNSDIINIFLSTCNDLHPYKKYLEDKNKLDAHFVNTIPGNEFYPFSYAQSLNIKGMLEVWLLDKTKYDSLISFIMIILHKTYVFSYNLYKQLTSPDIDVDEFVDVIMNSIGEIRRRIPRCDKAFDKIIKSVHMLKDNFGTYYKDFIETKNSTIIMENFVLDVSKNTKADPETTRQFRTIIDYYRKLSENSNIKNNPKLKKLFDTVKDSFEQLDKHENLSKPNEDSQEDTQEDTQEDNTIGTPNTEPDPNETRSVDDILKSIKDDSNKNTKQKKK
jgi:hypothetical protein